MFKLNEDNEYELEINEIKFVCESVEDDFEEIAVKIAECYEDKLQEIAEFMFEEDIEFYFGEMSSETLIQSLGAPLSDLGRETVTYLEHTLDDVHIIEFEYAGILDELFYLTIDGWVEGK